MQNEQVIRQFIIDEFLPDVAPDELTADHDLLSDGIVDSLGLLKVIAWLEDTFGLTVEDEALDPDNFRTIGTICAFIQAGRSTGAPTG